MNSFIFDEVRDCRTAKLGKYWYFFDDNTGEITFKTKRDNELLQYNYIKFEVGDVVYVTDLFGKTVLKSTKETLSEDLKQLPNMDYKTTDESAKVTNLDIQKFGKVIFDFTWQNIQYFNVEKNNKRAVVDEFGNIIIGYSSYLLYMYDFGDKPHFTIKDEATGLYSVIDIDRNILIPSKNYNFLFYFFLYETAYLIAQNAITGLWGIIDTNENIVIPFIYDEIYNWSIGLYEQTIIVVYKGKTGIIDIGNKIILPFKYKYIIGFFEPLEYSLAQDFNDKWGIIDIQANEVEIDLKQVKSLRLRK